MRYCLCAKVEGDIFLTAPGEIKRGDLTFELRLAPNLQLTEIAASIVVPEEKLSAMATTFDKGEGDIKLKIGIGGDRELYHRLISELQLLESDLSFATIGSLRKICWDNPSSIEFIPENDRDAQFPTIASYSFHKAYRHQPARLSIEALDEMISDTLQLTQLRLAKAFWREGLEYHDQFKYIQAFYSFYFVIEDFYAHGKTGESEVIKQFLRSSELQQILQNGFESILKEDRHKHQLLRLFKEENLEPNFDNLPKFLFRMRGKLHHYYSESSRLQGTPFNQSDFDGLSLLVMYIASEAIYKHDTGEWVKYIRHPKGRSA